MPITQSLNSKANVKKFSTNDMPFAPQQPVISSFYATSTAGQTSIPNLGFSIDQSNTDIFFLFINGQKLTLGSGKDYVFAAIAPDNTSSQITLSAPLPAGLSIQAYKMGLKKESEFQTDNRLIALYEAMDQGFQGFIATNALLTATSTAGTPAGGTFYSSISNRASIVDLSQDLKPRMGIERMPAQQIYQIQNEFGPNGELVYGLVGDTFGQVRFVGSWATFNSSQGIFIENSANNEFVEVTFYGTGLNALILPSSNLSTADARVSVDGGSEGSNIFANGMSGVLNARSYNANVVFSVAAGLTLGVHTVKIRLNANTGAYVLNFYGFEFLNDSALVKVTPGAAYNKGQKYTLSTLSSFAYSNVVTGIRGGRVLTYLKSDGTIGQSFQAVNGAQANLTSADHTNEEVVRVYHWREFGATRADDFSLVDTVTNGNWSFTLDDGTTTLFGNQVRAGSDGAIRLTTDNGYLTFTFVGTGLDIIEQDTGTGTTNYAVTVDGISVGNLSTQSASLRQVKIVSGLPYGTHTVRIARNVTPVQALGIHKFVVYQPKKPALPSAAVELADYNVMATFVANTTAGVTTISTGVLRKNVTREFTYVNGTGGTNDWTIAAINVAYPDGRISFSDRLNAYLQYPFFGSGFDFRFEVGSSNSSNITVSLNGTTLTAANFPTATFSVYGTGVTFNSATGVLDQLDATNPQGCGFTVSGLPIANYIVKFNNNSAGSYLEANSLDIITPIHSVKANIYGDLQNSLPVGSCGISDNRKLTAIKDAAVAPKAWVKAVGIASAPSTSSTSPVPLQDLSVTIKTTTGLLEISYLACIYNASTSAQLASQVYIDGQAVDQPNFVGVGGTNVAFPHTNNFRIQVSPGTHKVDVYWWVVSTGVATGNGSGSRNLVVREI